MIQLLVSSIKKSEILKVQQRCGQYLIIIILKESATLSVQKKELYSDISILYILLFVCSNRLEQKIFKESNGCKWKVFTVSCLRWMQENPLLLHFDSGSNEVFQEWKGKELGIADMDEVIHV